MNNCRNDVIKSVYTVHSRQSSPGNFKDPSLGPGNRGKDWSFRRIINYVENTPVVTVLSKTTRPFPSTGCKITMSLFLLKFLE